MIRINKCTLSLKSFRAIFLHSPTSFRTGEPSLSLVSLLALTSACTRHTRLKLIHLFVIHCNLRFFHKTQPIFRTGASSRMLFFGFLWPASVQEQLSWTIQCTFVVAICPRNFTKQNPTKSCKGEFTEPILQPSHWNLRNHQARPPTPTFRHLPQPKTCTRSRTEQLFSALTWARRLWHREPTSRLLVRHKLRPATFPARGSPESRTLRWLLQGQMSPGQNPPPWGTHTRSRAGCSAWDRGARCLRWSSAPTAAPA